MNNLIQGDNLEIMQGLLLNPEVNKKIKLIYIDPPFCIKKDEEFGMIPWRKNTQEKNRIDEIFPLIEQMSGIDKSNYLRWIYPRLKLMYDLLADDGSIYVHCDWRVNSYMRLVLDEIFGKNNYRNELIWQRDAVGKGAKKISKQWSKEIDHLLWYSKSGNYFFNQLFKESDELTHTQLKEFRYKEPDGRLYKIVTLGDYSQKSIDTMKENNLIHATSTGQEYKKYYLDEFQLAIGSLWNDIPNISHGKNPEVLDYPTQKPEKLLKRIIDASTSKGDLVADFFAGSGTTLAVAENLGRKWIGTDSNIKAIEICKKRIEKIRIA